MLRHETIVILLVLLFSTSVTAQSPRLGQAAAPGEIAAWDIDISPGGSGLPPGSGTAKTGAELYRRFCEACHGPEGLGGNADGLVGREPLTDEYPDKTIGNYWPYASTLFDFIRRAKPMPTPGSFDPDEVYALTAYLLSLNQIIAADAVMNASTLPQLIMPNRDGFISHYP